MSLEYAVTESQGAVIYSVKGRVDSATASEMDKAMQDVFAAPGRKVVLDFSSLDYISSAGLRIVLMLAKRAKQTQGRLVLCSLSTQVREVFEISGFLKILEVVPNQAAALA